MASTYRPVERDRERDRDRERERDLAFKERESHGDQSRDRPPIPTGPKISAPTGQTRQDTPKPSPTSSNPGLNSATAIHDISKTFQRFGETLLNQVQSKQDELALEKIRHRRDVEFKVSKQKHTEFPSVVEMHDKITKAEKENLEKVKKRAEQGAASLQKLADQMAVLLLQGLPLVQMREKALKDAQKSTAADTRDAKLTELQLQLNGLTESVKSATQKQYELAEKFSKEAETRQAALNAPVGQDDVALLKEENAQLRSELASNKSDNAALLKQVDDLANLVSQQGAELQKLREASDSHSAALVAVKGRTDDHSRVLSEFDPDNLSQAADFFAFEKPSMVADAATQRSELDGLVESIKPLRTLEGQFSRLKSAQDRIIDRFGGMVNDLRKTAAQNEERIQKLESATPTPAAAAAPEGPSLRGETEKLERDLHSFNTALQSSIQVVQEESDQKCRKLNHMVDVLNVQFNNLTTKELCDQIIGQIENLFPNTRQLQDDLNQLASRMAELETRLKDAAEENQAIHEILRSTQSRGEAIGDAMCQLITAGPANAKKRKVAETANGGRDSVENGHDA